MDSAVYITFLMVSFGLIIVPGPNVLVIISTSLRHGRKRGLQTVAGTSLAMVMQLLIVAIGTAGLVQWISHGLFYLKWLGVAYLLYLGLLHIKAVARPKGCATSVSASASFGRGFLVSLSNPKTLLFFSAFLPQFVTPSGNYAAQIGLLSGSFWIMAVVLDSCYALLSSKLGLLIKTPYLKQIQNGFSGVLYLGASAWLAATKRLA